MNQNSNIHHKSDIRKFSEHFMKESKKKEYQRHWMLAMVASYVRRTKLSVQCTDRVFRLKIHSNQDETKQKSFPKQE